MDGPLYATLVDAGAATGNLMDATLEQRRDLRITLSDFSQKRPLARLISDFTLRYINPSVEPGLIEAWDQSHAMSGS